MQDNVGSDIQVWIEAGVDVKQMTNEQLIGVLATMSIQEEGPKVCLAYAEGRERGGDVQDAVEEIYSQRESAGELMSMSTDEIESLRRVVQDLGYYSRVSKWKKRIVDLALIIISISSLVFAYNMATDVQAYGLQRIDDPKYVPAFISSGLSCGIFALYVFGGVKNVYRFTNNGRRGGKIVSEKELLVSLENKIK